MEMSELPRTPETVAVVLTTGPKTQPLLVIPESFIPMDVRRPGETLEKVAYRLAGPEASVEYALPRPPIDGAPHRSYLMHAGSLAETPLRTVHPEEIDAVMQEYWALQDIQKYLFKSASVLMNAHALAKHRSYLV